MVADPAVGEIRQARDELDRVIPEIQGIPGFENFPASAEDALVLALEAQSPGRGEQEALAARPGIAYAGA